MRKPIDQAVQAKRAEETRLVEQIGARVYNRQLLASCGHHVDDETAAVRARPMLGTVRLALEEAGVIERQSTPEPDRVLNRAELNKLLEERRNAGR